MSRLEDPLEVWFYNNQIRIDQPQEGYRAGTDAALLAASVDAKPNSKILELGSGSAAVLMMADFRIPGCELAGLENDQNMLALARHNTGNYDNIEINEGTVANIPKSWHLQFDQVVTNPPYFDDPDAVRMSDAKAPSFVSSDTVLKDWIEAMLITLKPRGSGTIIYRADGLEKILNPLFGKAGNIRILPIHSYDNEPAKRILVRFRKGVKSESAILPPLILHERNSETRYREQATQILCGELPIDMSV